MISVIIPSYNHEKYIERCINSVIQQDYQNWELIIIDDGSVDHSNELIAAFAATDARIIHVRQENCGAHSAINRGLSMARGDFLTILNSDDEYHPNRFARCIEEFRTTHELMFLSSWLEVVDVNNNLLATKMAWHNLEPWPIRNKAMSFAGQDNYSLNALMTNFVSTTSNMFFRREVYEQLGGMRNLRFSHDWDFLLRVCSQFACRNIPEPLIRYRIHDNNTISSNRRWMIFEICWTLASNIDRFAALLLGGGDAERFFENHLAFFESFNLQGNDHIFWNLYWNINQMRRLGVVNPEQIYLDDSSLREAIIRYVKDA